MNTQESRPPSAPEPGSGEAGPAGPAWSSGTDDFFDRIRGYGAVRPDEGRWIAGVCAGLARRWSLDPLLVRGVFVVGGLVTGGGLGIYGLLWLFLPHPDGRIHAQQVLRSTVTAGFVGSVLMVLLGFPLGWHGDGWPFQSLGRLVWLVLIGLGIWWIATRGTRGPGGFGRPGSFGTRTGAPYGTPTAPYGTPTAPYGTPTAPYGTPTAPYGTPTAPGAAQAAGYGVPEAHAYPRPGTPPAAAPVVTSAPPRRVDLARPLHWLTLTTVGAAVLVAAGVAVADRLTGAIPATAEVAVAAALGVVALGVVLAGVLGRRAGGLAPIAIVLAVAAINGAVWHDTVGGIDRDVTWRPVSATTSHYSLGAGKAVLDLTDPGLVRAAETGTSPTKVTSSLGVGELVVVVPSGVATEVQSSVGLGNITDDVDGTRAVDQGGAGLDRSSLHGGDTPKLVVKAEVGLGRVWIVPQGTEVDR